MAKTVPRGSFLKHLTWQLGIIACLVIATSAQYHPEFSYQPFNDALRNQASKHPSSEEIKMMERTAEEDYGFREWLFNKARESRRNIEPRAIDGVADTDLGNISQICYDDVITFFTDIDDMKGYAMRMYSSWGDIPTWFKALYTGSAKSYGAYELCVGITKGGLYESPFDAQYCALNYEANPFGVQAQIGSCWPSTCTAEELAIAHTTYLGFRGEVREFSYDCLIDIPWTNAAIATISLLSVLGFLCLIGSIYHVTLHERMKSQENHSQINQSKETKNDDGKPEAVYDNPSFTENKINNNEEGNASSLVQDEKNIVYEDADGKTGAVSKEIMKLEIDDGKGTYESPPRKSNKLNGIIDSFLMSFSVFQNTEKIFTSSSASRSSMLGALNGIRVLSMWWVILGHSIQFVLGYRFDNPEYIIKQITTTAFQGVSNGTYSVDSFFVLSGLLVTYFTLKQLAKTNGRINWFMFYVHRFLRLTPTLMLIVMMVATMPMYLGKGIGKNQFFTDLTEQCQKYWWTHPLYINNLVPYPGNTGNQACVGWAWYLANDMQFFLISPFIVYLLWKNWKWGLSVITLLLFVSFGSMVYLSIYWGIGVGGTGFYNNRTVDNPNWSNDVIYTKPWCRIQTFLVGMLLGYVIYKLDGKNIKMKKWVILVGWAISIAIGASVVYGIQATNYGPQSPQWLTISYLTLSRFSWAVALGWVIMVCVTGNGGYVNSFLSWSVWGPLAKLNYCAYLVHPMIIVLVILTKKSTIHWTYVEISYWFIGNMVASYACAYILVLLIEAPAAGLEKVLFGRYMKPNKKQ